MSVGFTILEEPGSGISLDTCTAGDVRQGVPGALYTVVICSLVEMLPLGCIGHWVLWCSLYLVILVLVCVVVVMCSDILSSRADVAAVSPEGTAICRGNNI